MSQEIIRDDVILLHGLGRSPAVMHKLEQYLDLHGFNVHNLDYPSTKYPVQELTKMVRAKVDPIVERCQSKIHLVGHSLGSIIIRYMLQENLLPKLGRVVMLAPPNHGTRLADIMVHFSFYRKMYGPAGKQLGERDSSFIKSLEMPSYEFGVIAGDRSVDKLFSWFILKGPDDGKVTVESTKLETMADHLVVHASHPFLPSHREVMQQTAFFLGHGYFQRPY